MKISTLTYPERNPVLSDNLELSQSQVNFHDFSMHKCAHKLADIRSTAGLNRTCRRGGAGIEVVVDVVRKTGAAYHIESDLRF